MSRAREGLGRGQVGREVVTVVQLGLPYRVGVERARGGEQTYASHCNVDEVAHHMLLLMLVAPPSARRYHVSIYKYSTSLHLAAENFTYA